MSDIKHYEVKSTGDLNFCPNCGGSLEYLGSEPTQGELYACLGDCKATIEYFNPEHT